MPHRIEDYAVIGNCETVALVGRDGSIDWLSLPRFDSAACFSALLGEPKHGRWLIAPAEKDFRTTRRYRGHTLILETVFRTEYGAACVIDFITRRDGSSELVRLVRGLQGEVAMRMELVVRFGYGAVTPWVSRGEDGRLQFTAGPDRLLLDTAAATRGEDFRTLSEFSVGAGQEVSFVLNWSPSFRSPPSPLQAAETLRQVEVLLVRVGGGVPSLGPWRRGRSPFAPDAESALALGDRRHRRRRNDVVAGEAQRRAQLGLSILLASRRDAHALRDGGRGFHDEARPRAMAHPRRRRHSGQAPDDLWRRRRAAPSEYEVPWLPGYEGATPVRVGNAAVEQLQLDIYGEILDAFYLARSAGLAPSEASWALECALVFASRIDMARPGQRHLGNARRAATFHSLQAHGVGRVRSCGALHRELRPRRARRALALDSHDIHQEVCEQGFDAEQNAFLQSYGANTLDASLLRIPLVRFLPPTHPHVRGTVAAIERNLV